LRAKLNHLKKIRVATVSYLNTKPLLYGIRHHPVLDKIELVEDFPSRIARMLIEGEVDLGLIPVAATTRLNGWNIISDYCIGCDGPVASVCIFSEVPMEEIDSLMLDNQSRTSVNLARILMKEYWKKDISYIETSGEDFRKHIGGKTAAVVIGDRALVQRKESRYIYDLGAAWKAHTGLPFVFAAWITTKDLEPEFIRQFNEANALGLAHLGEVVRENPFSFFDLESYYTRYISYQLDEEKKKGMELFLSKLQ
jgi:chorismate dehydratase